MWTSVYIVGNNVSGSDSVQCHTDLSTCCTSTYGPHRGDWYFPDGIRPFSGSKSMSNVQLRELTYIVGTMLTHQLVSITVIFQPMMMTSE